MQELGLTGYVVGENANVLDENINMEVTRENLHSDNETTNMDVDPIKESDCNVQSVEIIFRSLYPCWRGVNLKVDCVK